MFKEDFDKIAGAAAAKSGMLKNNPAGYFVLSMLAGMFIGFGILLVYTLSGSLDGSPFTKLIMGATFPAALSLVVIAGAELFTGNNMVMAAGILENRVTVSATIKLWVVCWIGNFVGSIFLAILFSAAGLLSDATLEAVVAGAEAKLGPGLFLLFVRGILCNMLVCMAVWSATRSKSDAGKLIMIFWCILAFFATGFEHSIANMTLFSLYTIASPDKGAAALMSLVQIITVTLGNMVGGIFLAAFPYYIASRN